MRQFSHRFRVMYQHGIEQRARPHRDRARTASRHRYRRGVGSGSADYSTPIDGLIEAEPHQDERCSNRGEAKMKMCKFCVLTAVILAAALSATGRGIFSGQGNGETKLNCAVQPCDAVARGRAALMIGISRNSGGTDARALTVTCRPRTSSFHLP
jgi:hypothetical protein